MTKKDIPLADFIQDMYTFEFDLEPVPQQRARQGKYGRFYTPAKSTKFKADLLLRLKWNEKPMTDPLFVEITFTFKKPKSSKRVFHTVRGDIDNYTKAVFDAFNGVLWKDDCQIVYLLACKQYDTKDGIKLNVFRLEE